MGDYPLNQWSALRYYTEDGWVEADNNIAENAFGWGSLGRKNFLFFGSDYGGERGALLYGLIDTCRLASKPSERIQTVASKPTNKIVYPTIVNTVFAVRLLMN
ncbi:Transposase IS66 family [Budvicia aquatica]|uniref:Transposase IS66 family n=1 Tax=Budvicia aquatica TaxID=82979 RepID=A0A484ZFL2_9GAMM|nr:Transposase IS66 family [Budvicia aquatica]